MGYDDVKNDLWGPSESEAALLGFWNANDMAEYFRVAMTKSSWYSGVGSYNSRAMAASFKKWREAGKTEEDVKALIDCYHDTPEARGTNPGWKDFLYRAEAISAMLRKPEPVKETKAEKPLSPLDLARQEGTYEAFLKVLRSPKIAQKYYDEYKENNGQG